VTLPGSDWRACQRSAFVMNVGPDLVGHVLADDVVSPRNVPSGPSTNIDGYAALRGPRSWARASDAAGQRLASVPAQCLCQLAGRVPIWWAMFSQTTSFRLGTCRADHPPISMATQSEVELPAQRCGPSLRGPRSWARASDAAGQRLASVPAHLQLGIQVRFTTVATRTTTNTRPDRVPSSRRIHQPSPSPARPSCPRSRR
jgi:hypothetical protein